MKHHTEYVGVTAALRLRLLPNIRTHVGEFQLAKALTRVLADGRGHPVMPHAFPFLCVRSRPDWCPGSATQALQGICARAPREVGPASPQD
jgi:hypothetical protein